jgi:hypothetical protein
MESVQNPFHYGSAVRGPAFADRERELRALTGFMRNGINVILLSPRRYGKSSLTLRALETLHREKARAARADLARCSASRKEFAEVLATAVFRDALGGVGGLTRELQRKLAQVRASVRLEAGFSAEGKATFSLSLAPHGPNTDWRQEISAVLHVLCEGAGRRATALVIDEFQKVQSIDPDLPWFFKAITDELPRLSLVFAGSRRTFMKQLTEGRNAPFKDIGQNMNLGLIAKPEMTAFLSQRAQEAGKEMPAAAAGRSFELARGVPDFVQQLAYHAFEESGRLIDVAAVDAGLERLMEHQSASFAEVLDRRPAVQQRLLKALAEQPERQPFSAAFLRRSDIAVAASVSKARRPLEDDELIELSTEGWRIFNPFFARWLRMPS